MKRFEVFYWRERNGEKPTQGLDRFKIMFKPTAAFIVGSGGVAPEHFLSMDLATLF